jgi:outer membrane lipoprotein SlyB
MKKIYAFSLIILLSSCVNTSLQPNVVSRQDAQKQQYVQEGVIVDIINVTIEGNRQLGATAGALIGGAAGKNVTDSETESNIAAVVGSIVGSRVGSEIGNAVSQKDGVELVIELKSGRVLSIIQEKSEFNYAINQNVRIIRRNGKSRVIPVL